MIARPLKPSCRCYSGVFDKPKVAHAHFVWFLDQALRRTRERGASSTEYDLDLLHLACAQLIFVKGAVLVYVFRVAVRTDSVLAGPVHLEWFRWDAPADFPAHPGCQRALPGPTFPDSRSLRQ